MAGATPLQLIFAKHAAPLDSLVQTMATPANLALVSKVCVPCLSSAKCPEPTALQSRIFLEPRPYPCPNATMTERSGAPGGPTCEISYQTIETKSEDGTIHQDFLITPAGEASEVELLRTIAQRLKIRWGQDEQGWWATVPKKTSTSQFSTEVSTQAENWAVWRQDDNGNRFLISAGHSRGKAEKIAQEFEARGHKQMYWVAPA